MNDKASVSKELNATHSKILEGLLKLPQNRECADCHNKGPRWASVNVGVFICMQCSGIHRSLGVHISKVRSATLDTWLPEQVAFMEFMGNEKANSYWEAKLPPNFDRREIAKFIRAKYEEKRWVANNTTQPMPRLGEICGTISAAKREDASRRTRNLLLDEEVLTKHIHEEQMGSIDTTNVNFTLPPPNCPQRKAESHTSRNSLSGSLDLLPCVYGPIKYCSYVTPPNWATFDCETLETLLLIVSLLDLNNI